MHTQVTPFTRDNKELEATVNKGIAFLHLENSFNKALSFLKENDVPIAVTLRVLLNRHQRRDTDWK